MTPTVTNPTVQGATGVTVDGPLVPVGSTRGRAYAVVGAYTATAEVVAVQMEQSTSTSLALANKQALANPHSAGESVVLIENGIIPVALFGVLPWGDSTVNGPRVQALINQLEQSTGGPFVIQFDVGLYGFQQGLVITGSGVRLRGCGNATAGGTLASTELWFVSTGGYAIDIRMSAGNYPGVWLEGFSIVGSRFGKVLGGAPEGRTDTGLHARTRMTVKDVGISGFNVGIQADFIDHTYWEAVNVGSCKYGMYVHRTTDDGYEINGPAGGNVRFEKCEFKSNGIADVAFSPAAGTLVSTVFADCHFGYSPCAFYVEPDATFTYADGSTALGQAGGLLAVVFDSTSFEGVGNRIMVTNPGAKRLQTGITNQGWGGITPNGGVGGNGWDGLAALGADSTMIQANSLEFFGQIGLANNMPSSDVFRVADLLNSFGEMDLGQTLSTLWGNRNRLIRYVGAPLASSGGSGLFPQIRLASHERGNWKGHGYPAMTTGIVRIGDLVELAPSGYVQQSQTPGAMIVGVAMEASCADPVSVSMLATEEFARINVATANTVARGAYVKQDPANPGCVVAAAGQADGQIVGRAVDGTWDNASAFGSVRTTLVKLSL